MTTAILPYPPSVNNYWKSRWTGKFIQHYISPEGRKFRRRVCDILDGVPTLTGPVTLLIDVIPPDKRKRDLDNILKALLDALQHAGVYEDDSQIVDLCVAKSRPDKPGRVEVTVTDFGRDA